MHAVLGNYYDGDLVEFGGVAQTLLPGINFTCSGKIESWTFGARWEVDTSLSYRYGGQAVKMGPILKSGTLQSMWRKKAKQISTTILSPLPCTFKQETFWDTIVR